MGLFDQNINRYSLSKKNEENEEDRQAKMTIVILKAELFKIQKLKVPGKVIKFRYFPFSFGRGEGHV